MKMLTLHQPWASLIAVGAKTIETRGWSTDYRGQLAIHAALRSVREKIVLGDWEAWPPDPRGHLHPNHASERPSRLYNNAAHAWRGFTLGSWYPLPLGAVVAVCDLVDVVPIVNHAGCRDGGHHVCVASYGALAHSPLHEPWSDGETEHDVTDQLPFGDFTPGRYAWLLDNVRAVDPVPCGGFQGLRYCPVEIP